MSLVKVFRQIELQGTLRITNEFNDYVQNQIASFEEWCNFIFMENDSSIWYKHFILFPLQQTKTILKFCSTCKMLKPVIQFNKYLGTPIFS